MSIFHTGVNPFKRTKVVPIFFAINNNYAPYTAVAMHALTHYLNPNRYYRVIILHDGLSWANRVKLRALVTKNCAIEFKKISNSLYLKTLIKYCNSKRKGAVDFFSTAVYYYRFFIPRLFPTYNKCVYIDSDIILRDDIGELFDTDLGDNVAGAVPELVMTTIPEFKEYCDRAIEVPHKSYVNTGVMVLDLKKMRKMRYLTKMLDIINKYDADLLAPDQDYFNVILKNKIKLLDRRWNTGPGEPLTEDTKLIHYYLFKKPWHYDDVEHQEYFWDAAKGTGYYGELQRQLATFTKAERRKDEQKIASYIKKAAALTDSPSLPLIKPE
ncbi:glycosyltransferase family 8 protein [Candidatus Saccharibacteria bacterium]|nr:glycosyltransferase family 8 protein [Candidatus Saccharibacteria bacterium]